MKRILVVLGTRPEVIKLAPVVHTLSDMETVETRICSTAQHREMLDDALRAFELEPEIDLALMRDNQRLGELFGRMSSALDAALSLAQAEPKAGVITCCVGIPKFSSSHNCLSCYPLAAGP